MWIQIKTLSRLEDQDCLQIIGALCFKSRSRLSPDPDQDCLKIQIYGIRKEEDFVATISIIAIIDICGSVTDAAAAEKRPRKEVFHRANQDQYRLSLRASFSRPICMPEEAAKEGGVEWEWGECWMTRRTRSPAARWWPRWPSGRDKTRAMQFMAQLPMADESSPLPPKDGRIRRERGVEFCGHHHPPFLGCEKQVEDSGGLQKIRQQWEGRLYFWYYDHIAIIS